MRVDEGEAAVRRVYFVVLVLPIVLVLAVSLRSADSDVFRQIALPGLVLVNGTLLVLLWRRWVSHAVVGLWVFLGPAAWMLARLATWELVPSTRPDNFGLLIAALAWFGVVFALAFLVFGTRRGAVVALGTYVLLYLGATMSAVGGMLADSRSVQVVVFLAAGHFVLILVVWVLARDVERLAGARARAQLLELQATTDPLTGIANRRRADEELLRQVAHARRYGQPFAVVLVDLDDFKAVNDTYGHEVGDQVLVAAVARLRSGIRAADLLGRWGGEEFVILAPQTSHAEACAMAERCREAMAAPGSDQPRPQVTASFGVATFDHLEDDARSLMRRADLALYEAKSHGRDRVVGIAGPTEAGGSFRFAADERPGPASDADLGDHRREDDPRPQQRLA